MGKTENRLGRGLESLIPMGVSSEGPAVEIEINQISPNTHQPRRDFDPEALMELADSIKTYGVVQPLIVVKNAEGYELVAGERRLRASKLVGLSKVPAVVREAGESEKLELAMIENIQRTDLNAMEMCFAYNKLNDEFGLSQDEIASKFGKSRSAVANCMRLSELPQVIQKGLMENKITEGHARTLLTLDDQKEMIGLYELLIIEGWSVRELESRIKGFIHPQDLPKPKVEITDSSEERALLKELTEILGAKVTLKHKSKGGELTIEYYSDEELERIAEQIRKSK